MPNQTRRLVFLRWRVDARPLSPAERHCPSLSVGTAKATLLLPSAVPLFVVLGAGVPGTGPFRLQVLWGPVRDGGNNYITLVFPARLALFKSPMRSFSLLCLLRRRFLRFRCTDASAGVGRTSVEVRCGCVGQSDAQTRCRVWADHRRQVLHLNLCGCS